ncbi:MAG: sigma-54 dependent transcriptional regulator [Holosporaceae bacterium]|jgi:transcriptional regulator with PAS, ATPase and Fis domain|nr:sigma-54 dependent transcriptional regulator [Holosporaceae bacterium]
MIRIIVVGEKLEDHLFEIIKASDNFGCEMRFFKRNNGIVLKDDDILVIDGNLASTFPPNIQNHVISVVFHANYRKTFLNETIIGFLLLNDVHNVLEKIISNPQWPVAVDKSTREVFRTADKIANINATVLITGETGTGKEVLAHYIHNKSYRANKKFVSINCAAIPDTLLESELFGHEKGAFTSAFQQRIGKFQDANFGTILLDEISEMSMQLQAKLLRVIQEKELSPLGSNSCIKLDVRIIATSNKNMKQAVAKGNFREDLYYRLNIISINIPKLADRVDDIIPLAIFFCKKYSDGKKNFSRDALQLLQSEKWNGNIRELENVVQRSVFLACGDIIHVPDIILDTIDRNSSDHCYEQKTLEQIEKEVIMSALKKYGGDRMLASESLGISLRTLKYKISSHAP